MTILNRNIIYLRIMARMTQKQLGTMCNLTKDAISALETTEAKHYTIRHELLARYLGYYLDYLRTVLIEPIMVARRAIRDVTLDAIEARLITMNFCIKTQNAFISPF